MINEQGLLSNKEGAKWNFQSLVPGNKVLGSIEFRLPVACSPTNSVLLTCFVLF